MDNIILESQIREIWKDIVDFPNYEVSSTGKVRNKRTMRLLKPRIDKSGYYRVILYGHKQYKNKQIHRLVAIAFIPNIENKPQVDHIDTVRTNNNLDNLRWVTYRENNLNELTRQHYREHHSYAITDETRIKMSLAKKGKSTKIPDMATRKKMSLSRKAWWKKRKEAML